MIPHELFQSLKDFLDILRGKDWEELPLVHHLYQHFLTSHSEITGSEELFAQFEACLTHMDSQGLIKKLSLGTEVTHILLKPALLDQYVSALINAISSNSETDGLGSILEDKVLAGNFDIPPHNRLKDKGLEQILLAAMVIYLQSHEIALREPSDEGAYLVFPSLVTSEISDFTHMNRQMVIFHFNGPVSHIYARLATRLSHSYSFNKKVIGKDTITFTCAYDKPEPENEESEPENEESEPENEESILKIGVYGLFLRRLAEDSGELSVSVNRYASGQVCVQFIQYIDYYLHLHSINLRQEYMTKINEDLLVIDRTLISNLDAAANSKRDSDIKKSIRYRASKDKIGKGEFDVYFCYNDDDKIHVKKIKRQLMEKGIAPFDKDDVRPGLPWQRQLEKHIKNIKSAAVFVGKTGLGPWQHLEIAAFLRNFVRRECPVIPVLLKSASCKPELPLFLEDMTWIDFRPPEYRTRTYKPLDSLPVERLSPDNPLADLFLSMELSDDNDQDDDYYTFQLEERDPNPIDLLVWGITGERTIADDQITL